MTVRERARNVGARDAGLDRLVLPVRPGAAASPAPPVRIFLGTEPAQYRAERVFIWSIERARDPGRVYEIVLMRDLEGFDRRSWTTSFTNYRFAVPHLAGAKGRAIYNDVDQVYLRDPAELFDLDLEGHGYLSVSDSDTSVMLLDCARMAAVWSLEAAQGERKRALLSRARAVEGLYGVLAPEWNARDAEYERGRSKLLHFTTLHEQPWRPFPERFVYHPNPCARLWFDMQAAADRQGFQVFTRQQPSTGFRRALEAARERTPAELETLGATRRTAPEPREPAVRRLVELSGARSLLEVVPGCGGRTRAEGAPWGVDAFVRLGLCEAVVQEAEAADGVLALSGLEDVPAQDAAWVVDELFRHAERFVFAAVPGHAPRRPRRRHPPVGTVGTPDWWVTLFEQAGARRPEIHWEIAIEPDPELAAHTTGFRAGGRFLGRPSVWVLTDRKPGHTTQSVGLAEELGWPYECKELDSSSLHRLLGRLPGRRNGEVRLRDGTLLEEPWPDLVIACGRRTAPAARWIRARSQGRTRIVQIGRKGVDPAECFDLTVAPAYARLLAHPRRLETAAPLTRVRGSALEEAALRWKSLLDPAPSPRIALLVGGDSLRHALTSEFARRMAHDVMGMAAQAGGSVFATTSRRTPPEVGAVLARSLGGAHHVHLWRPGQSGDENPYLGYLALADALVVTGESASMLAEACATRKPVYIYPLPERRRSLKIALVDAFTKAVTSRAYARPRNRRGTTRPQKRLERLCSILLARGIVRPPPDIERLHRSLVECGAARPFGERIAAPGGGHDDTAAVAARVRELLGYPG